MFKTCKTKSIITLASVRQLKWMGSPEVTFLFLFVWKIIIKSINFYLHNSLFQIILLSFCRELRKSFKLTSNCKQAVNSFNQFKQNNTRCSFRTRCSLFTCKCLTVWCTAAGCVVFVRVFDLPALSLYAFSYLSFLTIVLCAAYGDNGTLFSLTHTHISVKCLQEDISAFQTYYTRQSPPKFIKLVSMELINQTRVKTCAWSALWQFELLFFVIKACQNSVSTSSNDFLFLWCLFSQNEEKSQSEVSISLRTALLAL